MIILKENSYGVFIMISIIMLLKGNSYGVFIMVSILLKENSNPKGEPNTYK